MEALKPSDVVDVLFKQKLYFTAEGARRRRRDRNQAEERLGRQAA
jgi:hypothetical protein